MSTHLRVCPHCYLPHRWQPPPAGSVGRCSRCGEVMGEARPPSHEYSAALFSTALLLFLLGNLLPLLQLDIQGQHSLLTLAGSGVALWQAELPLLAVIVWLTSILAPGLALVLALVLLLAAAMERRLPAHPTLLRSLGWLRPWAMVDVFLLALLIGLVKLVQWAEIQPGAGLLALLALLPVFTLAFAHLDIPRLWRTLERSRR